MKKKPPKKRPANIERGTLRIQITCKFHATERCGARSLCLTRKVYSEQAEIACPRVPKDYQTLMGDVAEHDQHRLQRPVTFSRISKLINSLIIWVEKLSYVKFLEQLHLQLYQLREEEWEALRRGEGETDAMPSRLSQEQQQIVHLQEATAIGVLGQHSHRAQTTVANFQDYCKNIEGKKRSKKLNANRVFLCDKARYKHNGVFMTCFEMWHKAW
ncbi:Hypothetical protein PHPALM_36580 [Phytophthora palmivora]|uniref:Uncharacterized protein n=1 Tax=Phytophthora palmivora TaxID=4796 RepID=A0A2P4WZK3_9STRA|nr:Hypothetical protein PHPALM_36580 [Phytophthora palmivora]